MYRIGFTFLAILATTQLQGLLPPLYQTANEIKAILSDEQLGGKLESGEVIEKIEKNDHGYEIWTNKSHLQVSIVYEHLQHPGPAQYKLYFNDRISIINNH